MKSTDEHHSLDVTAFLAQLGMTRFHVVLLLVSCLVTFFDGMDFALISVTLPYLRDNMGLHGAMMGYVTSAAFLGQMLGSLVGSYLADLHGRRTVIIWCTLLGATFTFITGFSTSAEMLIGLRLLGGLAIGGLLAPAWSLNIETMPAGKRATAVTIIMLGFSAGSAAAGQVTNFLAPSHGWQAVFFACGAATMMLAIVLLFTLPESARWMVAKGRPAPLIRKALARFDPAAADIPYTAFTLTDETTTSAHSPWRKSAELFKGTLRFITPTIWFTYFCSSFAIYLGSSYGVLFLEALGINRIQGTNVTSLSSLLGAICGVLLLTFTERRGPSWIALAPMVGVPAMAVIGLGLLTGGPLFLPLIFGGTIMVGAGHAAVISMTAIYYPSGVRSTGGGWASFMAKFAAVAAPNVGAAYFLPGRVQVLSGYLSIAACLTGVAAGVLVLSYYARRLQIEQGSPV